MLDAFNNMFFRIGTILYQNHQNRIIIFLLTLSGTSFEFIIKTFEDYIAYLAYLHIKRVKLFSFKAQSVTQQKNNKSLHWVQTLHKTFLFHIQKRCALKF